VEPDAFVEVASTVFVLDPQAVSMTARAAEAAAAASFRNRMVLLDIALRCAGVARVVRVNSGRWPMSGLLTQT
jgi:hypothetical protein